MERNNFKQSNNETEKNKLIKKQINKFLYDNFKWFIVFLIIIIFITGFFKMIKPKYEETKNLVKIITEEQQMDPSIKKKEMEEVKNFLSAYSSVDEKYIEKINLMIPNKYNIEELFTEISHIVSNSSLILQTVDVSHGGSYIEKGSGGIPWGVKKVIIKLSVRGTDYKAFKNFLYSIENNLRIMDVTNVSFDPNGKTTTLIINTYFLE